VTFTTSAAPSTFSAGDSVIVDAGTGLGQMETILTASGTSNPNGTYLIKLTLAGNWNDVPAISSAADPSTIEVVPEVYNSVFYGNTLQDQTGADGAQLLGASAGIQFWDGSYNIVIDDNTTDNLNTGVFLNSADNDNPNDFVQILNNQFDNTVKGGITVAPGFDNANNSGPNEVGLVLRDNTISGPLYDIYFSASATSEPTLAVVEQNTFDLSNSSNGLSAAGIEAYNDPNVLVYQNTFVAPSAGNPAPAILYTDGASSALILRDNNYLDFASSPIYASTSGTLPTPTLQAPYNVMYASLNPNSSVMLIIPLLDDGPTSLAWTAASNTSWATLDSTAGSIISEDSTAATALIVSDLGLSSGTYFANIAVSANGITSDIGIWLTVV
jgi:hypothetical protein